MAAPNKNLKAILEYTGLSNIELAKALNFDPSLVSRYLSGQRQLKAASSQMEAIVDYILSKNQRVRDMEWLKVQFNAAGLPTNLSTVYRLKQNLIMWLASDGENLRRNLGAALPGDIAGGLPVLSRTDAMVTSDSDSSVKIGYLAILFELRSVLSALPFGSSVDIFLSNDQITTIVHEDMSALIHEMIKTLDLRFRLVVCISGNTQAMSKIANAYMAALVSGHVNLSVVHGMTQSVTNQMHVILPNSYAMLVTETAGLTAPPIATVIREIDFVQETETSFETAFRYAQPVLNIYDDNYSRNILEILYMEFCTPGALDVVKDNINPMYLPMEGYDRFLKTRGHSDAEYEWRRTEFVRFKGGMDENLKAGTPFREILSLARLNDIAERGCCRMAGLYFMERGFIELDARGCAALLQGYIDYICDVPNFSLLIVDDFTQLHESSCWQLKQNQHIAINYWSGPAPVMVHSDQLMLLREFQTHFDRLWARGQSAVGSRAAIVAILQDVLNRLKEKHLK